MEKERYGNLDDITNDKKAVRRHLAQEYGTEFAEEPRLADEKANNNQMKKRK